MEFDKPRPWSTLSATITDLMDESYKTRKDAEPRREYVGASLIGHHCDRFLAYTFHGTPKDDDKGFSGRTYRIFDMGHDGETRMADYIRTAGFELRTEREDGRQFGFAALGGRIKGHIDGVILSGPIAMPYPTGWENKATGPKKWAEFSKNGVKKTSEVYYGQCQLLMAYMDLGTFLFTAINRDTAEVHAELVEFDPILAQQLSDRAVRIVQSTAPEDMVRCSVTQTDYRCKFCDFSARCWKEPVAPTAPKPAWLR